MIKWLLNELMAARRVCGKKLPLVTSLSLVLAQSGGWFLPIA
jgi:hypothetical protein